MQTRHPLPDEQLSSVHIQLPHGLPDGAEILHVAFVTEHDAAQTTLMEFREPRACRAISVNGSAAQPRPVVTMLLVPTNDPEEPDILAKVWSWVEPGVVQEFRRGLLIMLWGARIIWSPGRAAIVASADRLEALRRAVIDFSFYDAETRKIETEIAQVWRHLDADTPLAFRFDKQAVQKRDELGQRFQHVIGLRARLVRVDPVIHPPPVHPATLASQLNERLKERTQLSERIEFLDQQLDLLEKVYDMCAQRSNEFVIAQNEARLEWTVIILLATETVALIVDLLAANRI